MKIIVIASQKGGVGKSTVGIHLSTMLSEKTMLISTDRQRSCLVWHTKRGRDWPLYASFDDVLNSGLKSTLKRAKENGCEYAVIDTPPHSSAESIEALDLADVVVVPFEPDQFSLDALKDTMPMIKKRQKPFILVVNRAKSNKLETTETIEVLKKSNLAHYILNDRAAYQRSISHGETVLEYGKDKVASQQMSAVISAIKEKLA